MITQNTAGKFDCNVLIIVYRAPSTVKNILYGKSRNMGIITLKMLCDGLRISLKEFFEGEEFDALEQEIK